MHSSVIVVACVIGMAACRSRQTDILDEVPKGPLTQASFGLLGVEFYESNQNAKRWQIRSDFAELHRSENYLYLEAVTADFHAEKTGNVVQTTSDQGRSYLDKNEVNLSGHVKIISRTGYEFLLSTLSYDGGKHEFRSQDDVLMQGPAVKRPTMVLRGKGLVADIDHEHFFLKRRVTAKKRLREGEWIHIRSSEGEFFTAEQRALFVGRVDSDVPPGLLVRSHSMELVSTQGRELMEAKGNVEIRFKEKIGHASSATFEAGGDRVVLEGNARVESNKNEVSGTRIVLYTLDDRVEVTQAQGRIRN